MDVREPTPYIARVELSGALIGVSSCTNRIVGRASKRPGPPPATTAHDWTSGQNWSTGFSVIMQTISTATDHSRAFARVLRAKEGHGPSLAALCRAFVEVAGRAWWLLESTDGAQLEHRAAAMRLQEVTDAGMKGVAVRVRDGKQEVISHEEVLRESQRSLTQVVVAGRREKVPNYTALATRVMSAAEISDSEAKYSHLSAVAHGHGFAVGGLGARGSHPAEGFTHFTIALPIANATQYLRIMTRVLNVVMERFIETACVDPEKARWRSAYVSAHNRIVNTFDALLPE